jgi:hypothetical protein
MPSLKITPFSLMSLTSSFNRFRPLLAAGLLLSLGLPLSAQNDTRATYAYPPQAGLAHLEKTDRDLAKLTDGRTTMDTTGKQGVWGQWDVKEMAIDWTFSGPVRVRAMRVSIIHPKPNSKSVHASAVRVHTSASADATWLSTPALEQAIPYEDVPLQEVRIVFPGEGIVVDKLHTVFGAGPHQIVLSEVSFETEPATSDELTSAQLKRAKVNPETMKKERASAATPVAALPAANAATNITYTYPPHTGIEHVTKTDPQKTKLADGVTTVDSTGKQAVWSQWGAKEMPVEWTFTGPVRIKTMRVSIMHPNATSNSSHASAVRVYGAAGKGTEWLGAPDFEQEIPFVEGPLQEVSFTFPDGGIVADRFRTVFVAGRHQVVLSEVSFETESATADELADAQTKRLAAQPEQFTNVTWLPHPLAADARVSGDSLFGVCGHFVHTNAFMTDNRERFNDNWRPSRTMPWLVGANFNWVRETLYMGLFKVTGPGASKGIANRQRVEDYLQRYQDHGLKVLLSPMFGAGRDSEGFNEFAKWIGELAKRFPVVHAVELHNEPNLKGFWKFTPQEFVDTARQFTAGVRAVSPETPIIAGSFSGWGGAWQHENLKELLRGPKEIATKYAEEVFRLGLLEFVDGVSAHPYRGESAPEAGEVLEAPTDPDGFEKEIRAWLDLAAQHTPGNKRLPLYLTEIGYSVSHQGYSSVRTVERQADYISRLSLVLLGVRLNGVPLEAVFWYDLKQDEIKENHYESNFGIVAPTAGQPRPAWNAVRRVNEFFANNADFTRAKDLAAPEFSNGPDLIKSYVWRRSSDGALIVPFWRMNQLMKNDVDFDSDLRLKLPVDFNLAEVELHDLHEDRPRAVGYEQNPGTLRIPVHVTSRAAWLVLKSTASK